MVCLCCFDKAQTVDGANASAIVLSLIETAKANHLNIYQYLYTLLLYMPDYKEEPAGIEQLMPWSEFIKENCSGITDTEKILPEKQNLRKKSLFRTNGRLASLRYIFLQIK